MTIGAGVFREPIRNYRRILGRELGISVRKGESFSRGGAEFQSLREHFGQKFGDFFEGKRVGFGGGDWGLLFSPLGGKRGIFFYLLRPPSLGVVWGDEGENWLVFFNG